ncbi:MAG: hypothetical protein M1840_007960 [Geoglossum simile]|nr:MAG: hypothetical protein M1840_007960 [Geoglossum simile]
MPEVAMTSSPAETVAEVCTAQLTEPAAVLDYLKKRSPLRVVDVQRIHGGMINFVYRLVLDQAIGETQQKTAILKYSAPYVASDPTTKFSVDRQIFEVRALKDIPWKQFRSSDTLLDSLCSGVTLPKVYFDDPTHHIIIMQDCMAEAEESWHPEQATNSFQVFCEQFTKSEIKYQTARTIGSMLGTFFAQLHDWGRRPESHSHAVELFGANNDAPKLIVEVHMTNILKNISKTGYQLSLEQQRVLVERMQELEQSVYAQRDTVILADFRPGNVLLSFSKAERLSSISIIDWEFAAIGPAFLDISNFVAELFFIGYLNGVDSTYAEVLDSFTLAYQAFGGPVDVRRTITSVGAAIIDLVPQRMDLNGSRVTMAMARKCVGHALECVIGADSTDFASLSGILRACQNGGE